LVSSDVNELRKAVGDAVEQTSLRAVGDDAGLSHTTVQDFIAEKAGASPRTLQKLQAWLESGGLARLKRQAPDVGALLEGEGVKELYGKLDAIENSGAPDWMKVLRTDALAASIRAEAMRQAEEAGKVRAAAIKLAEEAGKERASVAGREVDGANARAIALLPPRDVEAARATVKKAKAIGGGGGKQSPKRDASGGG
jgi:hypothetical protein